jgi:hypothetical protein
MRSTSRRCSKIDVFVPKGRPFDEQALLRARAHTLPFEDGFLRI